MQPKTLLWVLICLTLSAVPSFATQGTWEIIGTMSGFTDPTGLTFDGTWIWATEQHAAVSGAPLYRINPQTMVVEETRVIGVPNCCVQGLAWDGQYIWISGDGYRQYRYDPLTSELLLTCIRPSNPQPIGLASVAGSMVATGWYGGTKDCDLMEFDPNDCSYGIVAGLPSLSATGLAWTGDCFMTCMLDHGDPPAAFRRGLYKYSATGEQLLRYETLEFRAYDLAWDGEYLWVSDYGVMSSADGKIYKIKLNDVTAYLDIKPGSCPNPLGLNVFENPPANAKARKGGVLPVALLGTAEFEVRNVEISSLLLEGVAPLRWSYEDVGAPIEGNGECNCTDVGPDGYMDLGLKFGKSDIAGAIGSATTGDVISLRLTGRMTDGTPFEASDCVTVVGGPDEPCYTGGGVVLGPAVPNPFNPVTRISYALSEQQFVELSVYDAAGRLVQRLVSGVRPAGEHVVEWDAEGVASGVYFYRVTVGAVSQTRKMLLIK